MHGTYIEGVRWYTWESKHGPFYESFSSLFLFLCITSISNQEQERDSALSDFLEQAFQDTCGKCPRRVFGDDVNAA